MFGSGVFIPLSAVPAKWQWAANFNPMVAIVESYRYCLLGHGTVTVASILISVVLSVFALITGALIFQRTERTFIDTV
jgi:lipopolysaccharide transport system permease protein